MSVELPRLRRGALLLLATSASLPKNEHTSIEPGERIGMASSLADEACEACTSEDEPLTEAEYAEYLTEIDDDVWEVLNDHHLEGEYPFEDFRDALEFTYEIGELAEKEWHHPDIHLQWGEVRVEMWTHKIDGLHKTDFVMAARMDRIHQEYAPK